MRGLVSTVRFAPVLDCLHRDDAPPLVDPVQDAIFTHPKPPERFASRQFRGVPRVGLSCQGEDLGLQGSATIGGEAREVLLNGRFELEASGAEASLCRASWGLLDARPKRVHAASAGLRIPAEVSTARSGVRRWSAGRRDLLEGFRTRGDRGSRRPVSPACSRRTGVCAPCSEYNRPSGREQGAQALTTAHRLSFSVKFGRSEAAGLLGVMR